jgi:hypothetical protein
MPYVLRSSAELSRLREQCLVMKNLLRDVAENEASLSGMTAQTPHDEQVRLIADRIRRRKELCAEIDAVLLLGPAPGGQAPPANPL